MFVKNLKIILVLSVLFAHSSVYAQFVLSHTGPVEPVVTDMMVTGDPSSVSIGGYLGGRIDACIENRVMGQDVNHLIEPFYDKTETHRWQSEFLGKWILGASLAYRYRPDPVLMDKITEGINGLTGSQSPDGYIGNYAEEAQLQGWDIWGRKYSMLALLAYHDLTGDNDALTACRSAADHLLTQLGSGKRNIVETGFFCGMASSSILEPMVRLYKRTGEQRYLDFAMYIVEQWETPSGPRLIGKALSGVPVAERTPHPAATGKPWFGPTNGQKAYEMMSCYEALLELYNLTGDAVYLSAVEKTVRNIAESEINVAGSGSAFECWYHGNKLQTHPTYHTMETCVTMTWMKLCLKLLCLTGETVYADLIETTMYNALLASMKDDASQIAKYSPLEGKRCEGEEQCGMHINCCNANGPRAFGIIPQFAVMQSGDRNKIFVNLYSPLQASVETSTGQMVTIRQDSDYPADGTIRLSISTRSPEVFTLSLRIPSCSSENTVVVNGNSMPVPTQGEYHEISRLWSDGDIVELNLDVRGRLLRQNGYAAIVKGPVVLARDSRFGDGFVDETAVIQHRDNFVELSPAPSRDEIWLTFTVPMIIGSDLEGNGRVPVDVTLCDFASAGNTWSSDTRYRVWIPETFNAINQQYEPYNK